MSDVLINWFVTNLGGKVGKELILFIISMVPILELRGGLLAAGPAFLNIPMWRAIPVGIIGNLLPIPFILLLITKIFDWMKGTKRLKPVVEKLEKKAMSQSAIIEKYFRKAFPAIVIGVCLAACIMTIISYGIVGGIFG